LESNVSAARRVTCVSRSDEGEEEVASGGTAETGLVVVEVLVEPAQSTVVDEPGDIDATGALGIHERLDSLVTSSVGQATRGQNTTVQAETRSIRAASASDKGAAALALAPGDGTAGLLNDEGREVGHSARGNGRE